MFAKLQRFAGQSFIYTLGEALRGSLSFLLLPLYTRVLTPADYGILGVVGPVYSFLNIFLGLGIQGALMRFYFDFQEDSQEQRAYIGTVSTFLLGSSLLTTLLLTFGGQWFFGLVLPQTSFHPYLLLTIWNACISITQTVPLVLFRTRQQPGRYVLFTLSDFLLTTLLIILFVAVFRQGALGNLRAQVIAALLMAVPALWVVVRSSRLHFSWAWVGMSLAFSLPLLPHLLGNWVLNLSDRVVLDSLVSKDQIGLYTLGYQFGVLLNMVAVALNNAWVPFFYRHAGDRENDQMVSLLITYQVLAMAGLGLALALLSREAIEVMARPAYWMAYRVVPWIVLAYFVRFLYFFPVSGLFYIKRTYWVPIVTLSAGALNVGLNFWLVPQYGIIAAGINTFIGFLALLAGIFFIGQRLFPIRYQYGRLARILLLAGGLFAIGWWVVPETFWLRLLLKVALLAAFPVLLGLSGFFSTAERRRLAQLWRSIRERLPGQPQEGR